MSADSVQYPSHVATLLEDCRRRIFRHTVARGLVTLVIGILTAVIVCTSLDFLFGLASVIRLSLLAVAIACTGYVFWQTLIAPFRSVIPEEELGAAVDLSHPELNESIATLISLQKSDVTSSEAGSRLMRDRIEQQIRRTTQQVSSNAIIDGRSVRKLTIIAVVLLTLLALPLILWPSGSQLLLHRMVAPYANLAAPSNLFFFIEKGDRTVARGSTVEISAEPRWRSGRIGERPDRVVLELIAESGQTERIPMLFDETSRSFVSKIDRIESSFEYRVVGGGAESETFALDVVDAPEIVSATLTAHPPVYCGRTDETFDGMLGRMEVFEKSELEILLQFNKPVRSAALVWTRRDPPPPSEEETFNLQFDHLTGEEIVEENTIDEWDPSLTDEERQAMEGLQNPDDPENADPDAAQQNTLPALAERVEAVLSDDRMLALIDMPADVGGDFALEILDDYELLNENEPQRNLTVIYDQPPTLQVTGLSQGDSLRPDDILPVNCLAIDDVGIGNLELHYRVNDEVSRIVAATDFEHGSETVQYNFRLQLTDYDVNSGDRLTLRVRATDERPAPGPQETWSKPMTLQISDDAEALGAEAAARESKALAEALGKLSDELEKDAAKARELAKQARDQWNEEAREETRRLSEKEQQQGRFLDSVAERVATHPLMKDSADQLKEFSEQLRSEIPNGIDEAVAAQRVDAAAQLDDSAEEIDQLRMNLDEQIREIEERAELEKDLAELNRLALEAEQLAADADQLQDDATQPENRPEELNDGEWRDQLDQRREQLGVNQENLVDDLSELLRREQELLQAAQQAQRKAVEELSERASELANREQQVADGVNDEARDTGRNAEQIASDLDNARKAVETFNAQLQQETPAIERPDVEPVEEAAEQLREGNLAEPAESAKVLRDALRETRQQLQNAEDTPADAAQREELAQQSDQLAAQMENIHNAIEQLRDDRGLALSDNPDEKGDPDEAVRPITEMLERLQQLADAAEKVSDDLQKDPTTTDAAQDKAEQSADKANAGAKTASSGQFSQAAQEFRSASEAAQQSASQLNQATQQDESKQLRGLGDQFRRAADMLENLQQDDSAQTIAQQSTQQQIASETAQLSQQLSDVAERMALEQLQMPSESQQAKQAGQAAQQAQQSSQQASADLQSGQLQEAGQAAQNAAAQLQQAANQAQQASGDSPSDQSRVPGEVGESVAEALQNLSQAAQAMQQAGESSGEPSDQSSEQAAGQQAGEPGQQSGQQGSQSGQQTPGQPGQQGQPGEGAGQGQPGQGQSPSNDQLSSAAEALAEAARNALPNQFSPNQNPSGEGGGSGSDGSGNAAAWDGLSPNRAAAAGELRNWGQSNEELEIDVSTQLGGSRDKQYESLIRMYFREVARATANEQ